MTLNFGIEPIKNTIFVSYRRFEAMKEKYPRKNVIPCKWCLDNSAMFYTKAGKLKIIRFIGEK